MILRKKHKQYEAAAEGEHLAVLGDVEGLEKLTPWGKQQLRFKWFVPQAGKDGKQLSVIATYNNSIHENANLFQAIADITGAPPDDGFDTDSLIGANNRLTIKHDKKLDGSIFAKPIAILPRRENDPILRVPEWYKRVVNNNKPASAETSSANTIAQPTAANSRPVSSDHSELPPEPQDLEAGLDATSFPGDDATRDEPAA